MTLQSLPIFVRLAGRRVILVGEGEAADAKRRLLERAGAVVVGEDGDASLAIVADDDEAVARLKARGVLVNAVDRAELCDFTLPAIVDRSPVIVAIGTGGASAGLAAALRQRLEAILPAGLGRLAEALFAARGAWRARHPDAGERRRVIAAALAVGGAWDVLREHPSPVRAEPVEGSPERPPQEGSRRALSFSAGREEEGQHFNKLSATGDGAFERVALILASPDPDDLTLRQARLLANADRVTHGADVPLAILDRARADAARIETAAPPVQAIPGLSIDVRMA